MLMRRLYTLIERIPPPLAFAGACVCGMLLIVGSLVAGVDRFTWQNKQLGYFNEINWSFNFLVVFPLGLSFVVFSLTRIRLTIDLLSRRQMMAKADGTPVALADAVASWHRFAGIGMWVATAFLLLAMMVSYVEWWYVCVAPIRDGATPTTQPIKGAIEPGWTVGALTPGANIQPWANEAFGFAAFTAQGLAAGVILGFVVLNLTFACWIYATFTAPNTPMELLPDLSSDDARRGFEVFEPFVQNVLVTTLAFLAVLFLTRIDHLYLLLPSTSIWSFVAADVALGALTKTSTLFGTSDQQALFVAGPPWDYSTAMTAFQAVLLVVVAFIVPSVILRQAAARAQELVLSSSAGKTAGEPNAVSSPACRGLPKDICAERINNMVFWPLRHPTPVQLLLLCIAVMASFVFYKITLVLIGLLIILGVKQLVKTTSS